MKNNIKSLSTLQNSRNPLAMSRSPLGLRIKPLSQIENSIQKTKRSREKSKSKSKSKENTPEHNKVISSKSKNSLPKFKNKQTYFSRLNQKPKAFLQMPKSDKSKNSIESQIDGIVSEYKCADKTPSELSIESKQTVAFNYSSDYQLQSNISSQKSVKFSEKNLEVDMLRLRKKSRPKQESTSRKTPSILKQKGSLSPCNSLRSVSSLKSISSNRGSRTRDLIEMENNSINKATETKYTALFNKYQEINRRFSKNAKGNYHKIEKYTDDIFPPVNSSVFSYSIHNKTKKNEIQWKRIPELFPEQNLTVLRNEASRSTVKIVRGVNCSTEREYLVTCFNTIRQNTKILSTMFEDQQFNAFGLYMVKIFKETSWKYTIVDDLVPCMLDPNTGRYCSAFLDIEPTDGFSGSKNAVLEIWPFLLEKAYANYYSKYAALDFGQELDFMEELVGGPCKQLNLLRSQLAQEEVMRLEDALKAQKICLLGEKETEQNLQYVSILTDLNAITKKHLGYCNILDPTKNNKPIRQKLETLCKALTKLYVFEVQNPPHLTISHVSNQIKKQSKGSTVNSFSLNSPRRMNCPSGESDHIQRVFSVNQTQNCVISISQKDSKFYFQVKEKYQYIWIRAILVQKQHNCDYRWIQAKYSNRKNISIHQRLEPGQYILLLVPEWKSTQKMGISVNLYTEKTPIQIEKQSFVNDEEIFIKSCADIAQRDGVLNQINKHICAYNYVSMESGLVIENINNERQKGPVTVMRSINGLKCKVDLVPINKEFYFLTNSEYESQVAVKKLKKTIEVDIDPNMSYTVVLKTVGGIDRKFFDSFDFGS